MTNPPRLYDARTGAPVASSFNLRGTDPEALDPIRVELGRLLGVVQQTQIDVQKVMDALTGVCIALEEQLGVTLLDPEPEAQT